MKSLSLLAVFAVTFAALTGCSENPSAADAAAESSAEASGPTNRVEIPSNVRSNLGITFVEVERRRVANTLRIPGAFELQPLARQEYRLALSGRVDILVDQFEEVDEGTPLYRFRSPQWSELVHDIVEGEQARDSARAAIEVAEASLGEAQERLAATEERVDALTSAEFRQAELETRLAELRASIPRFEAEVRRAETDLANAERSIESALHRASAAVGVSEQMLMEPVSRDGSTVPRYQTIDWIEVTATKPGVVEHLALTDGAYADSPAVVLSTVDPTHVRFRAMGMQSDLSKLVAGQPARIVRPRSAGVGVDEGIDAILTVGLDANAAQRTISLLAQPNENAPWVRQGVSAFLEVVTDATANPVLAIPRSAVVKDGMTHVFFRRDPDNANMAIREEADLGVDDGRWVELRSGVTLGDEIVVDGAYELKLATEQSGVSQEGGHMHADGTFHEDH